MGVAAVPALDAGGVDSTEVALLVGARCGCWPASPALTAAATWSSRPAAATSRRRSAAGRHSMA